MSSACTGVCLQMLARPANCFCPYCNKQQKETLSEHIKKCYSVKLQFNDGTIVKLPEKDTFMK